MVEPQEKDEVLRIAKLRTGRDIGRQSIVSVQIILNEYPLANDKEM